MDEKNQKQDLRITRTHNALMAAMVNLLEKNSFQKITVNDLCDEAMVSRTTFYQHFEDKYHLLKMTMEEMEKQMSVESEEFELEESISTILDYILSKPNLFKNLLLKEVNHELLKMLNELSVNTFRRELESRKESGEAFSIPIETLSVFISGGIASLFMRWIGSDFSTSKEEMVKTLLMLFHAKII